MLLGVFPQLLGIAPVRVRGLLPDAVQLFQPHFFVGTGGGHASQQPEPLGFPAVHPAFFQVRKIAARGSEIARSKMGVCPQGKALLLVAVRQFGQQTQCAAVVFLEKSLACQSQRVRIACCAPNTAEALGHTIGGQREAARIASRQVGRGLLGDGFSGGAGCRVSGAGAVDAGKAWFDTA